MNHQTTIWVQPITVIIHKQVRKKINHISDRIARNVNKHYHLMQQNMIFPMIWVDCHIIKTKLHGGDTFFGNNFRGKKTIFVTFADHGQKLINPKNSGTNVNYIPRIKKNPKSDIKGKMLRFKFKQKRFAAGRLPNLVWQFGQTSRDVQNVQDVWDVVRPRRFRRPQRPISYIYIALS